MRRLAALAICLAFCASASAASAAGTYVALGDSYAAGPMVPLPIPPYGCLKSDHNYAHLAAQRMGMTLRDATCSGAETEDMTAPQGVTPGPNPPQFDSLGPDATLVTLQIGGNDIGFSGIAETCFSPFPSTGSPCRARYTSGGFDEVSRRIAETGPKVAAVLAQIRERAPAARILVVNYAAIFPHAGPGCWPLLPVAEGDVPWLRAKQVELNAMLAQRASAAGARLVDVYTASRGHDACALPAFKWTEAAVPLTGVAPVHPNLIGMLAMAELVAAAAP